ncbi:hypothetical protein KQX54_012702 [Cotesia glomerata]|uniref:Uncharacterized protein n=1 Tax=Cotesia glomerata TaxID=32391 RepID=A0AAV7HV54_COTGL|nr:hypothetical protein KQX54_012702 [Cotesia glomerata]
MESNVVIREENNDLSCDDHEEADTKIVHLVCKIDNDVATNILIKSCDTDVLVIMLGNMDHLECDKLSIFMEYGNNNKKRILNLSQLSIELGPKILILLDLKNFVRLTRQIILINHLKNDSKIITHRICHEDALKANEKQSTKLDIGDLLDGEDGVFNSEEELSEGESSDSNEEDEED